VCSAVKFKDLAISLENSAVPTERESKSKKEAVLVVEDKNLKKTKNMKKRTIVGLISIVAIVAVVMFAGCIEEEEGSVPTSTPTITPSQTATLTPPLEITSAIVSKVVDGDTIKLQNGERVRLLGI